MRPAAVREGRGRGPWGCRLGLLAAAFVAVGAGLLGGGGVASAHAFLVRTVPASGARLDRGPSELVLEFTERLEARPVVVVRTIGGVRIDGLRVVASDDPTVVRVAMPRIGRGVYVVGWQGVADDGHRSEGTWAFAVGDVAGATVPAPTQEQPSGSPWTVGLTWAGLLLLAVSVTAVASTASSPGTGPVRRSFRQPMSGLRVQGLIGAAVIVLAVRVAVVAGSSAGVAFTLALSSRVVRLGFAGVAFAGAALFVARWKVPSVVLLAMAASVVVSSGHALGPGPTWVGVVTVVHALLGLWWVASLAGVLVAVCWQPERLDGRVRLHARRAVVIVPAAVAAGVASAFGRLPTLRTLPDTAYGRWVIAKAVVIVAALAAAVIVRRSTVAKLIAAAANGSSTSGSSSHGSAPFGLWWVRVVSVEMVLIVAGVGAGVVLSLIAPPPRQLLVELGPSPVDDAFAVWPNKGHGNFITAVGICRRCGNVPSAAVTVAGHADKAARFGFLRVQLIFDERFSRQMDNLSRSQIQAGDVDWPLLTREPREDH